MSKHRQGKKHSSSEALDGGVDESLPTQPILREEYEARLHLLQVELVKLQHHLIGCGDESLVVAQGRDVAGKDGCIDAQTRRLKERQLDPLKQCKSRPIDAVAIKRARRLNLMRDTLSRLHYEGKQAKLVRPDPQIAFKFTPQCLTAQRLAR